MKCGVGDYLVLNPETDRLNPEDPKSVSYLTQADNRFSLSLANNTVTKDLSNGLNGQHCDKKMKRLGKSCAQEETGAKADSAEAQKNSQVTWHHD